MSLEKKSNYLDSCFNTSLVWNIEKKHKSNKQNDKRPCSLPSRMPNEKRRDNLQVFKIILICSLAN
jgi:hypothetical protein